MRRRSRRSAGDPNPEIEASMSVVIKGCRLGCALRTLRVAPPTRFLRRG